MERATLGRTGIEVPRLCVGCWQATGWASSDDARFLRTVEHAIGQGLVFLDTAEGYGKGHSEHLVGRAIAGKRDRVILATKFNHTASRPSDLRGRLESSLKRLRTDYVDLYQQHWPPRNIPLEETIGELERLKDEGKIRAVGVCNWMEPEWEEIRDPARVDCLQANHSLLWRSIEPHLLPLCIRRGIGVITYSSLCQGILAGRFRKPGEVPDDPRGRNLRLRPENLEGTFSVVDVLSKVAGKYHKTPAQTALRWILDQPGVTAAIVGVSRPEQVDSNLGALGWELTPEDWRRLAEVSGPLSADLRPHDTLWGWHPRESRAGAH